MTKNTHTILTKKRIFFSFLLQFLGLGLVYGGSKHWSKWLYSFLFASNILVLLVAIVIAKNSFINEMVISSFLCTICYPFVFLIFDSGSSPFIWHFLGLTYWLIGFLDLTYFFFKKDLQNLRTIYLSIIILVNSFWIFQVSHYDRRIEKYSEGLTLVIKEKKYGFINRMGIEVIPLQYDYAVDFAEGLAIVSKGVKFGFINIIGKEIIPFQYDDASSFSSGLARVQRNNLYGFIDKTGKEVIPLQYDDAGIFFGLLALVKRNNKWFYINTKGEYVKDYKENM